MVGAVAAVILVVPGCSSSVTPTVPTPASKAGTSSATAGSTAAESPPSSETDESTTDEAVAPLDGEACLEISGASLDLSAAMNEEDARTAADILERYDPPGSAKTAIEHFVQTGGAQFDDPDFTKSNERLDGWVHQVCPT